MNKSQIIVSSKRKKPLPVVILIGQSNAVGVGTIASAPSNYQGTIANTLIWNGSSFVNLVAGSTNQGADLLTFGPELSLCTQFLARSSAPQMYLIKHAVTNTSLNVDWLPTASTQYTNMITKINAAIAALVGVRFYIAGFVWVQGENDALSASSAPSANYQTNLTSLITNLRSSYGAYGADGNNNIPFVIAQLGYNDRNSYYYQDNVRDAQNAVQAAGTNIFITQTDDLSYNADIIHYDATAQIAIGNRAANQLMGDASYAENRPPAYSDIKYWFDPSTPNCALNSSSLPAAGGANIQSVLGRQVSPLINVANLTTANQPVVTASAINGRQAATFDGTNDQLMLTSVNPSQFMGSISGTIFLVQKYVVDKAASTLFINAGANANVQIVNKWKSSPFDDIFWDFANQSTGRIYGTAPAGITGNWKVTEFVKRSAGTSEVYVGGTSALSGSTSGTMASLTGTLRIGTDGSNYFNGQIAEILCYNRELTSGERTAVYSYINTKYGL
jgi:hypothetical protein